MTSKEKKLKAIIELVNVQGRIEELERTKSYMTSATYYRNRLTALEEKAEKLQNVIDGKDEVEEVKIVLRVPAESTEKVRRFSLSNPEEILQFFKTEKFVLEG